MSWATTADPEAYLAEAGAFLRADPAANSVMLTVLETMRERDRLPAGDATELLGFWRAGGEAVSGAFMHTPPYPVYLAAMPPEAVPALVDLLAADPASVRGVGGDRAATDAFATAWTERTGTSARVQRHVRLHRLGELADPDPWPAGRAVVGGPEHRDALIAWYEAFAAEIDDPPHDVRPQVDDRIAHGGTTLWLAEDGEPVALAGRTRLVAGQVRIAPVYTPPERRGRGYAVAATAVATRGALDAGAREVLLYTDLANPTANRLYARLGFRAVEDRVMIAFDG